MHSLNFKEEEIETEQPSTNDLKAEIREGAFSRKYTEVSQFK